MVVVVVVVVTGGVISRGVAVGITVDVIVSDGVVVVVVVIGAVGSEIGVIFSGAKGATGKGEVKEEGEGVITGSGVIGSGINGWLEGWFKGFCGSISMFCGPLN